MTRIRINEAESPAPAVSAMWYLTTAGLWVPVAGVPARLLARQAGEAR